jgi:magnesium chelatase subunit H
MRAESIPVRVLLLTMDTHLASATERVRARLQHELPGLSLELHAASEWAASSAALERTIEQIGRADLIFANMLFMEEHYQPILGALMARRGECDALLCAMSAGEMVRLTRLGGFDMGRPSGGALALLRRLRGNRSKNDSGASSGEQQMRMLRRLPKILRFIPGTAQDVRHYFLALQYWLGGSCDNLENLVRMLITRYAAGAREPLRASRSHKPPQLYPDTGLYYRGRIHTQLSELPGASGRVGTVGLLVLRSYVLAGNTAHYDAVISALERQGLRVLPAFASGLDARPAIEQFFLRDGVPGIDALVSLTGFSLVGGPAYNDSAAAAEVLKRLDVPYLVAHALEFQTLEQWQGSERGLLPIESTMMVAIPELDGSSGPMVFGGRSSAADPGEERNMQAHPERAAMLAARAARWVALRRTARAERRIAIVLFNFPPGAGNAGSAAYLSVFESLLRTLRTLAERGYSVQVPRDADALRISLLEGNAALRGTPANVHTQISVDTYVRRETWLREIEAQWGAAPGRDLADSRSIYVLGQRFGNVFVGIQPSMGYEGDPMRLLFSSGFAPTHCFAAFYRWLREDFAAHAVLHFGTHGALEFMPGKQTGLSGNCWPDRLIGDLPNLYLYAANNPSEGTIAKRRSAATTISYLTPPVVQSGLYRGLQDLKGSLERWRALEPQCGEERERLAALLRTQAAAVELGVSAAAWQADVPGQIEALARQVLELEYTLIPQGLHVLGSAPSRAERLELLSAIASTTHGLKLPTTALEALIDLRAAEPIAALCVACGAEPPSEAVLSELMQTARRLAENEELPALMHALEGGFVPPAPGGDLLRNPAVLPTGRNLHGFDPFRIPSVYALEDGARQAERLLQRCRQDSGSLPESIAIVLWGTDNLKSEGGPIGQVLALLGARPRFDGYGRLAGATLIPLAELGRPRIDVMVTVSGIFRDLLPLQMKLLAESAFLAASADEPEAQNFVRKHALAYQRAQGCDLETAALRVFGNAEGAYGANVNHLIESGRWGEEDELAETYARRKCYAFARNGRANAQSALLQHTLKHVSVTYQNLDSVELGVTTVDHYFDTLGGISRAVRRANGGQAPPVYIGDQTQSAGAVRSLAEQVSLETHTRMLNPKWYDSMLEHGYEGVRQIETHLTNTMGWSATTGQVAPWVYQKLTQTYLLDPLMRERLAALNPAATAKVANRLIEAQERQYWQPDAETLDALRAAGSELEDRLEGVFQGVAA